MHVFLFDHCGKQVVAAKNIIRGQANDCEVRLIKLPLLDYPCHHVVVAAAVVAAVVAVVVAVFYPHVFCCIFGSLNSLC